MTFVGAGNPFECATQGGKLAANAGRVLRPGCIEPCANTGDGARRLPHRGHQLRVALRLVLLGGIDPLCKSSDGVDAGLLHRQLGGCRLLHRGALCGDEGRTLADRGMNRLERLPVGRRQALCGLKRAKKVLILCHGASPLS